MRKIYICEETGSVYWLDGNDLMYAPLSKEDTVIDFEDEGGVVDKLMMRGEVRENGMTYDNLYRKIERELWKK